MVYLNGAFKPRDEACIMVDDRGFLFGDGIYEVIRVVNGRPFRLDAHLSRMDLGLKELKIRIGERVRELIPDIMQQLIQLNGLEDEQATLYLQITRGVSRPRKHIHPEPANPPTILITANPFEPDYKLQDLGGRVVTVPDVRWMRCDLKTINLLPNTLAAQQGRDQGASGILMVRDGFITEGANYNVFAVVDGVLFTHPDSHLILSGITRSEVIDMAAEAGFPIRLEAVSETEILNAGEVFLCGTTTDILPVIQINDTMIGNGRPGHVTRTLQTILRERMHDDSF